MVSERSEPRSNTAHAIRRPNRRSANEAPPIVVIRRPTREDAIEQARALFLASERVDLQALTRHLGVARATLHRWVGARELLLTEILAGLATEFVDLAYQQARGDGDELVLDFARHVMELAFHADPVRHFVGSEPQLALRLILAEDGAVHARLADGVRRVLADTRSAGEVQRLEGFVHTFVQLGTALEWATFAIGDRPQMERVIEIGRSLLVAHGRQLGGEKRAGTRRSGPSTRRLPLETRP
jgi:AcrR family transcriptional regulator